MFIDIIKALASKNNKQLDKLLSENLISKKVNLNHQDNDGKTLLMKAAETGNLYALSRLHKYGADINLKNKRGDTAQSLALAMGMQEAADLLEVLSAEVSKLRVKVPGLLEIRDIYNFKSCQRHTEKTDLSKGTVEVTHSLPFSDFKKDCDKKTLRQVFKKYQASGGTASEAQVLSFDFKPAP